MSHFWRFAATLEKDFRVPYDRDREVILCPECKSMIVNSECDIKDYSYMTEDGYIVYNCPICGKALTCRPIEY